MKKVVIGAGHGGSDSVATGDGFFEKEYILKIPQYIHDRLDELGIENTMVRTTDETLEPNARIERILAPYGSDKGVLVVSNYINAGGCESA